MHDVIVLYNHPADPEAFDAHYRGKHGPLVDELPNLREFAWGKVVDGDYYIVARMSYDNSADAAASMESPPDSVKLPAVRETKKLPSRETVFEDLRTQRMQPTHYRLVSGTASSRAFLYDRSHPSLTITTTGRHLARTLAHAVQDNFEGRLRVRYEADDNLVQAIWSR